MINSGRHHRWSLKSPSREELLGSWASQRCVLLRASRQTRAAQYLLVGVLALVAVVSMVLTILGGDYWGSPFATTVYFVAFLALFGAAVVAMDFKTFVRISETGVDASQSVVWRDHLDWADVDRFEVSLFWTRSMVRAVNKDGSTFVALRTLDISWTEQKTSRTWRGYQADAVEVLNRALADVSSGA